MHMYADRGRLYDLFFGADKDIFETMITNVSMLSAFEVINKCRWCESFVFYFIQYLSSPCLIYLLGRIFQIYWAIKSPAIADGAADHGRVQNAWVAHKRLVLTGTCFWSKWFRSSIVISVVPMTDVVTAIVNITFWMCEAFTSWLHHRRYLVSDTALYGLIFSGFRISQLVKKNRVNNNPAMVEGDGVDTQCWFKKSQHKVQWCHRLCVRSPYRRRPSLHCLRLCLHEWWNDIHPVVYHLV